ncbi:kidney mitochondrial carrier protein 1 [Crassostrea virginica]|uniref:Mitochondrial UCP5-like protein n=2 Tax=Crassostrea virginica TaxID=6565 RepID=C3U1Y4_CRAVI|nr:mitochondrial UCP5-like protein [Crassostrea virginica]
MNDWRPFIYGGIASVAAESGTFPIDTTKTRLQVQGQTIDVRLKEIKYRGMVHALKRIYAEEGVRALYSGLVPALLRQSAYGTIKIGVYYSLKGFYVRNPEDETLPINVFCGVVAGVVGSVVSNPTDVLKVRMQAQRENGGRETFSQAFIKIYKQEGVSGLWRGVSPTAQRAATVAGVILPAYDICKFQLRHNLQLEDSMSTHFMASFMAGLVGAVFSTPIDVVKTRMMNQKKYKPSVLKSGGVEAAPIYKSSLDCLIRTVKTEGPCALYKGFCPTWVRLGPWNIIFFMMYEQLKKVY